MKKLTISFKNTSKDTRLWLEIDKQEEKSQFVKDALYYYIQKIEEDKKDE